MKHYTDTIPLPLAEKLKEKGMPIRYANRLVNACPNSGRRVDVIDKVFVCPMYAECFDWLMERGQRVYIIKSKSGAELWHGQVNDTFTAIYYDTWHEAANAAIEKALTLI